MTGIVLGLLGLTVAIALAGRLVLDLLAPERSRMVSAVLAYPFGQTVLVLVFVFLSNLLGTFYAFRGAMGLLGIAVLIQSYRALPRTAAFARAGAVSAHLPICVITSYSIHYTKLYDARRVVGVPGKRQLLRQRR